MHRHPLPRARSPHRFAQVDVQLTCCAALARIAETASRVPTLLHTTLCDAVLGAMRRASSPEAAEAPWSETWRLARDCNPG